MWPKTLFDLLPHLARLLPMADKYLSAKESGDKEQKVALAALSDDLRRELARATEAQSEIQTGVDRHLQEQSAQIGQLAVDATRARMGVESIEAHMAKLEKSMAAIEKSASIAERLLGAALGLLVIAFALLTILVVRVMR